MRLSYLSQIINNHIPKELKDFFNTVLSEVVRDVSVTRNGEFKRFRMPEEKIKTFKPDVFRLFEEKTVRNIKGLIQFNNANKDSKVGIYDFNSSICIPEEIIKPETVDMVVTSPPYGDSKTTVAYGQFSRWANEWFGFENAKNLDCILMGGKKQTEESFTTICIRDALDKIKSGIYNQLNTI